MRKSRFSGEQITMALRQAEAGTPVEEICRKLGVSPATFFRWKKRFGGLGGSRNSGAASAARREPQAQAAGGGSESRQDDPARVVAEKMVRPAQRRAAMAWAREAYALSERRACRAVGVDRSFVRYRSVRPHQETLRKRLRELARVRVRAGYKQLHVFLRREGWPVNHKRVYRLYTEEGLTLKRRRPKRHRSASVRKSRPMPTEPNQQWATDFMHDTLATGETIRLLTAIDLSTRECVILRAGKGFT